METNAFNLHLEGLSLPNAELPAGVWQPKVQPEEARFGPELDWGKLWRGQVFGELEAAFGSESTL